MQNTDVVYRINGRVSNDGVELQQKMLSRTSPWHLQKVKVPSIDMHTINDLRKVLGLETPNQVRNRIEAIRDLLSAYLRRGPNNQLLVTDTGVGYLRRLQELCDTGLTLKEASEIIAGHREVREVSSNGVSPGLPSNQARRGQSQQEYVEKLTDEIRFLRERVVYLEEELMNQRRMRPSSESAWWETLREETDGS